MAAALLLPALHLSWHATAGLARSAEAEQALVVAQLTHLERALAEDDAAASMQSVFPEGACYLECLYGLTWAQVGRSVSGALRRRAIEQLEAATRRMESDVVLLPFADDTQVRRGVFWLGQRTLLLAELSNLTGDEMPPDLAEEFDANCQELATAFAAVEGPLDAYPGQCWPCDSVAAVVALALHDEQFGSGHRAALDLYLDWVEDHADPRSAMIPGRVVPGTWEPLEPTRGCTTVWNVALLRPVAPEFAAAEYERARRHLGVERLGFQMFREWPAYDARGADIDSGPIIWGVGMTATGVGLAAARSQGDLRTADDIEALAAMFGLPGGDEREHRLLFGAFPVGDAFLAWGRSLPLPEGADRSSLSHLAAFARRSPLHILVLLWCALVVWAARWARSRGGSHESGG